MRRFLRKFETVASATSAAGLHHSRNVEVSIESLAAARFLAVVAGVPPAWVDLAVDTESPRELAGCLYSWVGSARCADRTPQRGVPTYALIAAMPGA